MQEQVDQKSFGYAVDQHLTKVLASKPFTLSAEVIPPRNGEDQAKTMAKLSAIVASGVDFLSVTRGAGGSLRGGSLPIAQTIKDHYDRPCIAHFTCRDLVPQEIENLLVDHHYFGIRNILALRGDPPMGEVEWTPRDGGYRYAYQLIEQIRDLNQGKFIERKGFAVGERQKTDFCIGCAVYPEHPNEQERYEFARLKFALGAEYGITQMLFDPDYYGEFLTKLQGLGVTKPLIPGVRILRSQQQANMMATRFGCSVPAWYVKMLPAEYIAGQPLDEILQPFILLVEKLKANGAPGAHIFVLNDIELCQMAMKILKDRG